MDEIIDNILSESLEVKLDFFKKNKKQISHVASRIVNAFKQGQKLLIFGNGGSAADAQHLAAEFVNRMLIERPPLPALALSTDTSILTSISNDYSYDEIFTKQIKALGKKGDIALGISTSGRSRNVVDAIKTASKMELFTVSLTGGDGGELASLSHINLNVGLGKNAPRTQETHLVTLHIIAELVDRILFP
ncbi:MAG: SIS domain-containing protein [Deltaproteobacteria bacterium]|nr:SIS domain-containing protein [Deltaproteobacteria bacterium]